MSFVLKAALLTKLVMPGILFSPSGTFVFKTAFLAKLVISAFQKETVAFIFNIVAVRLGISFSISVIFVFQSEFLTRPLALDIFLSTSLIFF